MISYLFKTSEILFLHYIKKKNKIIALVGDFNCDLMKYGIDTKIENFLNFMIENHFLPFYNIFLKNTYERICGNILQ